MEVLDYSLTFNADNGPFLSYEQDPNWEYIDPVGHKHRWKCSPVKKNWSTPTLRWAQDESYLDEDGEEIEQWHKECKKCGSVVDPGWREAWKEVPFRRWCEGTITVVGSWNRHPGSRIRLSNYLPWLHGYAVVSELYVESRRYGDSSVYTVKWTSGGRITVDGGEINNGQMIGVC